MSFHNFKANFIAAFALTAVLGLPASAQRHGFGPGPGTAVVAVTAAETQWLTFAREEEKLARDVYLVLYAKWGTAVFDNIAVSEQRHFDTIGNLLTRYGITDPASATPGVFKNAELATLYNELVAKGSVSLQEALAVGVIIEKKDIADLESALRATTKADLKRVFTNLMNASYNHLEAFEAGCAATTN